MEKGKKEAKEKGEEVMLEEEIRKVKVKVHLYDNNTERHMQTP